MNGQTIKVLIIDDDEDDYILTRELFSLVKAGNYSLDWASSYEEGLRTAGLREHHVCLVDYRLGAHTGVELIREARESRCSTPMILLTGSGDHDIDVAAMDAGATDYLIKDETTPTRLERTIRYAVQLNIERCRAEDALQANAQKQAIVAELGRLALTGGDLAQLFKEAVTLIAGALGTEYCEALELLPDGSNFVARAGVGWEEDYSCARTVSAGRETQAGFTLLSDEPLVLEDFRTETRFDSPRLRDRGILSGLSAVLRGRDRAYGVLEAHSTSLRRFTAEDLNFLRSVANVIAEAVARKRAEQQEVDRVISLNANISERKLIEVELKQARDTALESVRLKSEFLANMSHEIRTPMNGVVGMTGLLLATELTSAQLEYAETIQSSADALLIIIDDILDFSKIEAGLMRLDKIDFDLSSAVESPVELLYPRADAKGLELASLVYRGVPTTLQGDPGRLRQILTNLIGNAIKFTERGEVIVTVTLTSETATHALLRFEIQDTGIGISPEARTRLFHAFTQADGSTTRKYGGTGLGLAISKQLVELMGGQIGIESTPGVGTTFWFTSMFEKQVTPASVPLELLVNLAEIKVLIVDDNAANRRILKHQAGSWKMIATEADSGRQALELLRDAAQKGEPFLIAILDLMMPEMDGFQLAEEIKADSLIAGTAIILLPSFGQRGHGERARQVGIAGYLQKPVRQSQLHRCLMTVLSHSFCGETVAPGHLVTRHSIRESQALAPQANLTEVRILIAEDNLVNQSVALGQLYNLGYGAEAVGSGRELLAALEIGNFDLILMDCQMPDMDGFAATAEVRRREGTSRHTTIIAMTANALDGDRERCLMAGMDDYMSKPVRADALSLKLAKWLGHDESGINAGEPRECEPARETSLDQAQLAGLKTIRKANFFPNLVNLFIDQTDLNLKALHTALTGGDVAEILRLAHQLKGSSANIGATQMAARAEQLESADPRTFAGHLNALDQEFVLVRAELELERDKTPALPSTRRPALVLPEHNAKASVKLSA